MLSIDLSDAGQTGKSSGKLVWGLPPENGLCQLLPRESRLFK